jgi:hypothetical protein
MFKFNSKTQVDRVFKIKELYKIIKADKVVKVDAAYIEKVTLDQVISTDTINMKSNEECTEIYIFKIELNQKEVPLRFIKSLDEAIKLHTYFILQYGELVKELCIYRQVQEGTIKFGRVYESEWQNEDLKELPYCSNIKDVYKNLVFGLIPMAPNEDEELNGFIDRYIYIEKLRRNIVNFEKKAYQEKQPRKKFDIGRDIRDLQLKLKEIEGDK